MFATANGQRIVEASIGIPAVGLWEADVLLATELPLTGSVSLVVGDLSLVGAVVRSGTFAGATRARLVGGFGGWRKDVPAQAYTNPRGLLLSTVLLDVAAAVGEQVRVENDRTIGVAFVREAAPAQRVLRQLAGTGWYVDAAGVTRVGSRPSLTIGTPFTVEAWDAARGLFSIATENYSAWVPGASFTAATVPTPQTVSFVRLDVNNAGTLRLNVLVTP